MKYDRGIFIYLEPRPIDGKADYAQCDSCRMFVPGEVLKGIDGSRCIAHGSKVLVDEYESCGVYLPWPDGKPIPEVVADHAREIMNGIAPSITPEESGLVDKSVQCHRCAQYQPNAGQCGLYAALNKQMPEVFDLEPAVQPNACCNAWTDEKAERAISPRDERTMVLAKSMAKVR